MHAVLIGLTVIVVLLLFVGVGTYLIMVALDNEINPTKNLPPEDD